MMSADSLCHLTKVASVFCICFQGDSYCYFNARIHPHDQRRELSHTDAKLIQARRFRIKAYRAVGLESLYTAGVVVLNTATGFSLQVFEPPDEADDLAVLTHAGGELGPQMDQVFLKGCGNVRNEKPGKNNTVSTQYFPVGMIKVCNKTGRETKRKL